MVFNKLVLILLLISSCKSEFKLTGVYVSRDMKNVRGNKLMYVTGSKLRVNPDSTYALETCGNISSGTWQYNNNLLILTCNHNRYKNDSINKIKGNIGCGSYTYMKYNHAEFINVIDSNFQGAYILVDLLERKKR